VVVNENAMSSSKHGGARGFEGTTPTRAQNSPESVGVIYWEKNGEKIISTDEGEFVFINFLRGNYWPHGRAYPIDVTPYGCFMVHEIDVEYGVPLEWRTYTVYEWRPEFGYSWHEVKIFKGLPVKRSSEGE